MVEPITTDVQLAIYLGGVLFAMMWSFLMASRVAPPRAKRLILDALEDPGSDEVRAVRHSLIVPETQLLHDALVGVEGNVMKTLGALEGRIGAAMPENMDGRVAALQENLVRVHEGIQKAMSTLDEELQALPERIKMAYLSTRGVQERRIRRAMNEAGEDMETEIVEAEGEYDLAGPEAEFVRWMRKPIDPEYEAKSPTGAAALRFMKAALAREYGPEIQARRTGYRNESAARSPYGL